MCDLHYKRMQVCNGQLSWQGLCADRNCLYALEVAAAEAAACNFEGVPSEALLCGPVDGENQARAAVFLLLYPPEDCTADRRPQYRNRIVPSGQPGTVCTVEHFHGPFD